jgi:hypothetical protein
MDARTHADVTDDPIPRICSECFAFGNLLWLEETAPSSAAAIACYLKYDENPSVDVGTVERNRQMPTDLPEVTSRRRPVGIGPYLEESNGEWMLPADDEHDGLAAAQCRQDV